MDGEICPPTGQVQVQGKNSITMLFCNPTKSSETWSNLTHLQASGVKGEA